MVMESSNIRSEIQRFEDSTLTRELLLPSHSNVLLDWQLSFFKDM
jgi:hypothetical protein